MKFIAIGVGPGDPDLITLAALKAVKSADLVIVPQSAPGRSSLAEGIVRAHVPQLKVLPLIFPMTRQNETRDAQLAQQLEEQRDNWKSASTIAMPVIGDSALYATAAWLYGVWKTMEPSLKLELVPGVSAHSLAAARAGAFLAMGEQLLTLVPATAPKERLLAGLKAADAVALYKPLALGDGLAELVEKTGPWRRVIRADRAGLPDESFHEGEDAVKQGGEYLSTLLLWR